jgi:hypothetical protein
MESLPTPGFNLPYGVNSNDPHLTGEWPIHAVVENCNDLLVKANQAVDEVGGILDSNGLLDAVIDLKIAEIIDGINDLDDHLTNLIPEEPEYDGIHDRLEDYDY